MGQMTNEELLKPLPNPFTGKFHTFDQAQVYADDEEGTNLLLQIGFEPYAVTSEPETRKEVLVKLTGNVVIRNKVWYRRCREIPMKGSVDVA